LGVGRGGVGGACPARWKAAHTRLRAGRGGLRAGGRLSEGETRSLAQAERRSNQASDEPEREPRPAGVCSWPESHVRQVALWCSVGAASGTRRRAAGGGRRRCPSLNLSWEWEEGACWEGVQGREEAEKGAERAWRRSWWCWPLCMCGCVLVCGVGEESYCETLLR
jgi:hypothetical protein